MIEAASFLAILTLWIGVLWAGAVVVEVLIPKLRFIVRRNIDS